MTATVALAELRPFAKNPRTIQKPARERLRASLDRWGLYKPLVAWRDAEDIAVIIGGNQRLSLLNEMVEAESLPSKVDADAIPVVWFSGTEAEARTIALRDNNSDGEWDWATLPDYMAELRDIIDDGDDDLLGLTGFDEATIADLEELASSVDIDLDRFTGEPEEPEPDPEPKPTQPHVGRRFAKFTVGNIGGNIPIDLYARWLHVFENYSQKLGSTDIPTIVGAMLDKTGDP